MRELLRQEVAELRKDLKLLRGHLRSDFREELAERFNIGTGMDSHSLRQQASPMTDKSSWPPRISTGSYNMGPTIVSPPQSVAPRGRLSQQLPPDEQEDMCASLAMRKGIQESQHLGPRASIARNGSCASLGANRVKKAPGESRHKLNDDYFEDNDWFHDSWLLNPRMKSNARAEAERKFKNRFFTFPGPVSNNAEHFKEPLAAPREGGVRRVSQSGSKAQTGESSISMAKSREVAAPSCAVHGRRNSKSSGQLLPEREAQRADVFVTTTSLEKEPPYIPREISEKERSIVNPFPRGGSTWEAGGSGPFLTAPPPKIRGPVVPWSMSQGFSDSRSVPMPPDYPLNFAPEPPPMQSNGIDLPGCCDLPMIQDDMDVHHLNTGLTTADDASIISGPSIEKLAEDFPVPFDELEHKEDQFKEGHMDTLWAQTNSFVKEGRMDYICSVLVFLNAILLGVQTDWQARNATSESHPVHRVLEIIFCMAFGVELLLRIVVLRCFFFHPKEVMWNCFDTLLVASQLIEEGLQAHYGLTQAANRYQIDLSVLRLLRVLRLIRIMRMMRVLRLIGDLRTLVMSIVGSLRSLIWAVVLLILMMYVVGVCLTQVVNEQRLSLEEAGFNKTDPEWMSEVTTTHFGSVGSSVYALWMAVTGGFDWGDLATPLQKDVHFLIVPLFMSYIAFVLLCMLNVITGVFVESALITARNDKDVYMVNHARQLFLQVDSDCAGTITWDEFEKALEMEEMREIFRQLDLDFCEAAGLFQLLDSDRTGEISFDEFVDGCTRLRGPAKALDLNLLHLMCRSISERQSKFVRKMEHSFSRIDQDLTELLNGQERLIHENETPRQSQPWPAHARVPPLKINGQYMGNGLQSLHGMNHAGPSLNAVHHGQGSPGLGYLNHIMHESLTEEV